MTETGLLSQLVLRVAAGLLHFVWQGVALAFVAAVCLAFLERRAARTRYAVAVGFLAAMLAAPMLTVFFFHSADAILSRTLQLLGQPPVARLNTEQWASWIAAIWLAGVTTGWVRLAVGWRMSLRMIRQASAPGPDVLAVFERVAQQTRSGAVRLLVSARAVSPVVIGWIRPVVLLPVTVLTGLTVEELRVVVAHELAHVRRHDYLVNVLQRVVESLLFYHPAVWWLSARVRAERELAADEAATEICDDPAVLARALVRLEETRSDRVGAIAATGGNVANRIARLLHREPDRSGWQPIMAAVSFLGVWALAGLWSFTAPHTELPPLVVRPIQANSAAAVAPVETALTTGLSALAALAPAPPERTAPLQAPQGETAVKVPVAKGHADVRRVSGRVRDSNGGPAPKGLWIIAVPVVRTIPNVGSYIDETDAQRRYQMNIPPGRYTISVEGGKSLPLRRIIDAPQRTVTVPTDQVSLDLDLDFRFLRTPDVVQFRGTLLRRNELWGRVEFDDGSALPVGALPQFQVILSSGDARFRTQPFTNTQGLFMFPAVPGEYTVRVAPLRIGYYLKSITYGNIDLTRNPLILKTDIADTDISIVLAKTRPAGTPPGVKVSGRVTGWKAGRPALPLIAILTPADAFEIAEVSPKDDGSFEIDGVPPGQYAIGPDFARSRLFEVTGGDLNNLVLTMNDVGISSSSPIPVVGSGRYIRGVIEAGNGKIPEFEVRFTAARPGAGAAHVVPVSGQDFSLILPEGEYRIAVSGLPSEYVLKSITAGPLDLTESFLITHMGVADRITGAAIRPEGITIRLNATPPAK